MKIDFKIWEQTFYQNSFLDKILIEILNFLYGHSPITLGFKLINIIYSSRYLLMF